MPRWLRRRSSSARAKAMRHTHPLVREIASAAIPAAVRRELHSRAAATQRSTELPIEVARPAHALRARRVRGAALARAGRRARAAPEATPSGAVLWLHRGLELARREMVRGELDDPMQRHPHLQPQARRGARHRRRFYRRRRRAARSARYRRTLGPDRAKVLRALANVAHERDRSGEALGTRAKRSSTQRDRGQKICSLPSRTCDAPGRCVTLDPVHRALGSR